MKRTRKHLQSRRMEMNLIFRALTNIQIFKVKYVLEFLERQYGMTPQAIYLALRECEKEPHAIEWHNTTLIYRLFYDRQGRAKPITPEVMDMLSPETDLNYLFKPDSR